MLCFSWCTSVRSMRAHWDSTGIDDITLDSDEFVEVLWTVGMAVNLATIQARVA